MFIFYELFFMFFCIPSLEKVVVVLDKFFFHLGVKKVVAGRVKK